MSDESNFSFSVKGSTAYDAPLLTIRADDAATFWTEIGQVFPAAVEGHQDLPTAVVRAAGIFKNANDLVFPPAAAAAPAQSTPAAVQETPPAAQNPFGGTSTPPANSGASAAAGAASTPPAWGGRPAAGGGGGNGEPAWAATRNDRPTGNVSGMPMKAHEGTANSGPNAGQPYRRWVDPRPYQATKDLPNNLKDKPIYIND